MKSVSGASASESKSSASRWACIAAVGIGFLFVVSLSGNNNSSAGDESLRSGQAKHPSHSDLPVQEALPVVDNTKSGSSGGSKPSSDSSDTTVLDEEEIDKEVAEAESHFDQVVKDQLESNSKMIVKSIDKVMEGIRESLNNLLGDSDDFDEFEITALAGSIEEQLQEQVQQALEERVADLVATDDEDMETVADLDAVLVEDGGGAALGDTEEVIDLKEEESKLVVKLRDDVNDAATDERGKIRHRAAMIAKSQLEMKLAEKFGSPYTVTVDENDVLVSFKKKTTTKSSSSSTGSGKSSSKSSSSSSSHSSGKSSSHSSGKSSSSSHHSSSSSSSSSHHSSSSSHHSSSSGTKKKSSSHHSSH